MKKAISALLVLSFAFVTASAFASEGKSLQSCSARVLCKRGGVVACKVYGDEKKKVECSWSAEPWDYVQCSGFDASGNWKEVFLTCEAP